MVCSIRYFYFFPILLRRLYTVASKKDPLRRLALNLISTLEIIFRYVALREFNQNSGLKTCVLPTLQLLGRSIDFNLMTTGIADTILPYSICRIVHILKHSLYLLRSRIDKILHLVLNLGHGGPRKTPSVNALVGRIL